MGKIVCYGIPRSGTTVVYQVLAHVFGKQQVIKTHNFICDKDKDIVVIHRDFRDVMVSLWQINLPAPEEFMGRECISRYMTNDLNIRIPVLDQYKKHPNSDGFLWLRYENLIDFDYLLAEIEDYWDIIIDDKDVIREKYSIESNKKIADKFNTFKKYDEDSLIHGKHINSGEVGIWKKKMTEQNQKIATGLLQDHLKRYGYEL